MGALIKVSLSSVVSSSYTTQLNHRKRFQKHTFEPPKPSETASFDSRRLQKKRLKACN